MSNSIAKILLISSLISVVLIATAIIDSTSLAKVLFFSILILIILQHSSYVFYRKREDDPADYRYLGVEILLYGATLSISYLLFIILAWIELSRWPSAGSYWQIFLAFTSIGLAFQIILQLHWVIKDVLPLKRLISRQAAIIIGFVISNGIGKLTADIAVTEVQSKHQILFDGLLKGGAQCALFKEYYKSYIDPHNYRPRSLHTYNNDYLLTFYGGSIDIDGSTIIYDSKTDKTTIIHNDLAEKKAELKNRQSEMDYCDLNPS